MTEIWTCDSRGKAMRQVGSVMGKGIRPDDPAPYLGLTWLPGSRKLSFDWNDRLYTVRAP